MSEGNGFRSWRSFADSDEVRLSDVWAKAVVQMALLQASESAEKEGTDQEAPFFEDPVSVFNDAVKKNGPSWWPKKLERVLISIRATPSGATTDTLGPHPLDPNSKDLGSTMFSNIIVQLMDGQGDPFSGSVNIQIKRASDKTSLGGWKRDDVYVGTKAKKKTLSGGGGDGNKDELFEYMAEKLKEKDAMMERMFSNSASVIGASASLVNATRGVNAAPPWMNGEDGSSPMWMAMMQAALGIGGALMGGQNPGKTIQQIMSQPVQNNNQMMIGNSSGNGNAGMLTDNGGQIGGTDQFLDGGQYDGFNVMEDDLLEDDFETLAEESDPEEDDEEEEEYEEDEEEDEEEERPRKKGLFSKRESSGESLKGKSPEEVAEMLESWIPEVKDKGKLQQLGLKLASKIMR